MKKVKALLLLTALLVANGSRANLVQVKINAVDQRTALENQALGSYRVDDLASALLMKYYYRNFVSTGKACALRDAQLTIKRRFPHFFILGRFLSCGRLHAS